VSAAFVVGGSSKLELLRDDARRLRPLSAATRASHVPWRSLRPAEPDDSNAGPRRRSLESGAGEPNSERPRA